MDYFDVPKAATSTEQNDMGIKSINTALLA